MFSIDGEITSHMISDVKLAEVFAKSYANNFSQKVDKYLKKKTITYNNNRYKSKKIDVFFQSQKIGFPLFIN